MWNHYCDVQEVTSSSVMIRTPSSKVLGSVSGVGCFTDCRDLTSGFLITRTVVPSEHPPNQAVSLQFSRWPHKGATKISPSQTSCILSVTFSFPLLMGSVCIPLSEWLLLTLSAHFDFNCHPSISNVIFSFSHLISCAHLKSAPSPHPSVFVMGRCAGAHLNWSHFSLTRGYNFWTKHIWGTVSLWLFYTYSCCSWSNFSFLLSAQYEWITSLELTFGCALSDSVSSWICEMHHSVWLCQNTVHPPCMHLNVRAQKMLRLLRLRHKLGLGVCICMVHIIKSPDSSVSANICRSSLLHSPTSKLVNFCN